MLFFSEKKKISLLSCKFFYNFSEIFKIFEENRKISLKLEKNLQLKNDIFFFCEKNSCKMHFTAIISILIFWPKKAGFFRAEKKENGEKRPVNYNVWGLCWLDSFLGPAGTWVPEGPPGKISGGSAVPKHFSVFFSKTGFLKYFSKSFFL